MTPGIDSVDRTSGTAAATRGLTCATNAALKRRANSFADSVLTICSGAIRVNFRTAQFVGDPLDFADS
jgi:hypothetical protein